MACAITTQWGNHVYWIPPNRDDISHYNVYRRTDEVPPVGTADVVAHVPFTLGQLASPHFWDPFTAVNSAPAYTYWITSVAWDGQCSALSNKITATTGPSLLQTSLSTFLDETNEPNGFPNRTDSVMSFSTTTMTFSISPAVTSFNYYVDGVRYTAVSAKTQAIPETSGLSIFYFTSAGLTYTSSVSDDDFEVIVEQKAICSVIYYNTADRTQVYFGEERHGIQMDGKTHHYLHDVNGLMYESGFAINTITADATGALDAHAQFGIDAGIVYDEDIDISASAVINTTGLTIFWRSGSNGYWRTKTNAGFSVYNTAVGSRITYNAITSGEWSLIEVVNNDFTLVHVFATTKTTGQVIAIMGQNDYLTLAAARAGATTEINNLLLGSLPGPEMRPLATVIFQTSNAYGNAVKARVRSTDTGTAWYDWRTSGIQRGSGGGDHGSLSGLSDDDHIQYLLLAGRTSVQTICGALTLNGVSSDLTIGNNNIKIGTACSTLTLEGKGISLSSTGDITIQACGTLTLHGGSIIISSNLTIKCNMSAQGTVHICGVTTINNYVDLPEIAIPANPAANTGRLYSKDDGGGNTKIYFLDSAGTETDLTLSGGGGGNTIYIEADAATCVSTNAANAWLVFDSSDFNVSRVGQCATITVADDQHTHTIFSNAVTISPSLTVGTLTITATISVGNTMHVCGATTFGSTVTISGITSINNNLNVSGVLTGGTVNIGTISAAGSWHVCGATTLSGTVTIGGITIINNIITVSTLNVTANASVQGTLWVSGATTLNGLTVSGAVSIQTLNVTANASVQGTLHVSGAVTFGSTVAISSTLTVNAATNISSSLTLNAASASFVRLYGATGPVFISSAGLDLAIRINDTATVAYFTSYGTLIVSGQFTRQLLLNGDATASAGIWFNGTTGIHIGCTGTGTAANPYISNLTVGASGDDFIMWNTTAHTMHYCAGSSARRYKTNIRDFNDNWSMILNTSPKIFNKITNNEEEIGYIAEDIEELGLEKLLIRLPDGRLKGLHYKKFTLYTIEVIKQLNKRIEKLEKKLEDR